MTMTEQPELLILTRRQLDSALSEGSRPEKERAGPLWISPRCHQRGPVNVSYDWTTGLLTMGCAECGGVVCQILVAADVPAVTLT